jgi:sulfoxide reductase catalytic subunit YedY
LEFKLQLAARGPGTDDPKLELAMPNVLHRPAWSLAARCVTPEAAFRNRREFLRQLGLAGGGLLAAMAAGCDHSQHAAPVAGQSGAAREPTKGYPAARNPQFDPKWRLTNETAAATYNNFYEFSSGKDASRHVGRFVTSPWPVEIAGLIKEPMTLDALELAEMFGLEERIYRFRCVEAWAMVVPWTGFPLVKLIDKVQPKPEAKFVRFVTFHRPEQAPGTARTPQYPWPYHEGLSLDEAMHPLTLLATGIYGKPLPKQHGAPLRLVVPWKYGYKSIKSIVKIEFVSAQPQTFWETLAPDEYPFESNVNPKKPHPRWSQATERLIDTGDRVRTRPFNGYGDLVAKLYPPL